MIVIFRVSSWRKHWYDEQSIFRRPDSSCFWVIVLLNLLDTSHWKRLGSYVYIQLNSGSYVEYYR